MPSTSTQGAGPCHGKRSHFFVCLRRPADHCRNRQCVSLVLSLLPPSPPKSFLSCNPLHTQTTSQEIYPVAAGVLVSLSPGLRSRLEPGASGVLSWFEWETVVQNMRRGDHRPRWYIIYYHPFDLSSNESPGTPFPNTFSTQHDPLVRLHDVSAALHIRVGNGSRRL